MAGKKNNYWVLIIITALAVFVRLYGLGFISELPPEQKASAIFSILAGISSVVGLYFLVKELFDEKLAAISSFLLAVSWWHIFLSQSGATEIFLSFALIFAFYFIWHGLKYGHTFDFFLAGLFGGSGLYAGKSYFVALFVALLVFLNYWDYIKKDFPLSKYEEVKIKILGGFSLLVLTTMATALPIGFYIWQNPGFILSANNSVFTDTNFATQLFKNLGWIIDKILLVEFNGLNLISWPVSIFFVIGFIKELVHWLKRKHGHFSVVHTLIFSWLFIMILPILLSSHESSAGLSVVLPPIIILAAKGVWWVIEKLNKWNHLIYPRQHKHWADLDAGPLLAMLALLVSIAILEISKLV